MKSLDKVNVDHMVQFTKLKYVPILIARMTCDVGGLDLLAVDTEDFFIVLDNTCFLNA